MCLRFLLGILLTCHLVSFETIIEYGGISFECEESFCAFPEQDPLAKKLLAIFDKEVSDTSDEAGFLKDEKQRGRIFKPYSNDADICFPFIRIEPFNREENGITNISGLYEPSERLFYPDDEYFVTEKYPINQTGLTQAFNRIQSDLEFYADVRVKNLNRKMDACNQKISLYQSYQESGFTHILIENRQATQPVRSSDYSEEDLEDGPFSYLEDQIRQEEELKSNFLEKINNISKTARVSLSWLLLNL